MISSVNVNEDLCVSMNGTAHITWVSTYYENVGNELTKCSIGVMEKFENKN